MSSLSAAAAATSTYTTPIYHPIQPSRRLVIDPTQSTRKSHFRRLYDIYHVALQRGNIEQAKKAYSLLVRCKEFDWAANWRTGLDMVDLPTSSSDLDNGLDGDNDIELDTARQIERQRRLIALKVDYLRECHTVHSRKVKSKRSIREPEAILIQIVMLLASAKQFIEALNELELYLPLFPYRDNALLHYYAGLLCIYLAQSEMLQDQARNLALSSSQGFLSSSHPGSMDFGSSQAHLSSSVPFKQARSRSSSTSSSTSTSSSSSNGTIHNLKSTASSSKSANKPKSAHKVYANIKDAIEFSKSPSLQLVQKILQASPIHANDARKWFELARKISSDKGERFDDLDDWLGLLNGRSVEETRAQRKVEVRNLADVEPITPAVIPREYYYGPANSSSSPSAVLLPLKSPRSILKMNARRTIISGSEGGSSQAVMEDDEEGEITITQRNKRTLPFASSGRLSAESNIHVNDVDDDDDESDDGDPFGRTKEERRKRKRDDRMVTFASIGTEGFDLDISD